jgi:Fe-coproporphyrin III synthase
MGYSVVSVSGGEPLMYRGLERVLAHATSLGLFTTITTNGYFNERGRLSRLRELVNLVAVSLDGPPEIHNEVRGSNLAFDKLERGLETLRGSGIPFGFVHTLTERNWEHLLWVAEFAAANGAGLLQIHPLEIAGRAAIGMQDQSAADSILAAVYVLAFALGARYEARMRVQLDLIHRDLLRDEPGLVYAADEQIQLAEDEMPARLLGLLVLEPDGALVPVSYGFSRRYTLCDARERSLREAWPEYHHNVLPAFHQLCRRVWAELSSTNGPMLSNWHETIVARSQQGDLVEIPSAFVR